MTLSTSLRLPGVVLPRLQSECSRIFIVAKKKKKKKIDSRQRRPIASFVQSFPAASQGIYRRQIDMARGCHGPGINGVSTRDWTGIRSRSRNLSGAFSATY
jgi:hypothetical protein